MPDFNVVPVTRMLLVEGRSQREAFRGIVLAIGWREDEDRASRRRSQIVDTMPEMHYLVSDESKPAPIWVEAEQLSSQQWFPVAPAASPASG
jgi:hypothetical protein